MFLHTYLLTFIRFKSDSVISVQVFLEADLRKLGRRSLSTSDAMDFNKWRSLLKCGKGIVVRKVVTV